ALFVIKYVTFIGELFAAFIIYKIVLLAKNDKKWALMSASMVAIAPSIIINGSSAGQCDIFYVTCLLAFVYSLLKHRPYASFLFYGLAVSFKLQAIFLSPMLLLWMLTKEIDYKRILIVPLVYLVTLIPCWLESRNFIELLTIYKNQYDTV